MKKTVYTIAKFDNLNLVKKIIKENGGVINRTSRTMKGGYLLECEVPKENIYAIAVQISKFDEVVRVPQVTNLVILLVAILMFGVILYFAS